MFLIKKNDTQSTNFTFFKMKKTNVIIKNNLINNILVFLLFNLLFIIQWFLIKSFQSLDIAFAASLIYLPHGLRVLATLIGGTKILPGLFFGHLISGFFFHYVDFNFVLLEMLNNMSLKNMLIVVLTSLGSTYAVIMSIYFLNLNLKIIKNISLKTIFIISIISSIINSFFTNSIYYIGYDNWHVSEQFFQYILGDVVGAFIVFYFLKYINNHLKYSFNKK